MDLEYKHIFLKSYIDQVIDSGENVFFNVLLTSRNSNIGEYIGENYVYVDDKKDHVTGLTSNLHIDRLVVNKTATDITKKYRTGGTFYVDGVSVSESIEDIRIVYYINRVRYEYNIPENKTIFYLYYSLHDTQNYTAKNKYVKGELGKISNKHYNDPLFIERDGLSLRDKIDIFRGVRSTYGIKTIIGGNFFKFE